MIFEAAPGYLILEARDDVEDLYLGPLSKVAEAVNGLAEFEVNGNQMGGQCGVQDSIAKWII